MTPETLTPEQARQLYMAMRWSPAVGIDSKDNEITNQSPLTTIMDFINAPRLQYGYITEEHRHGWMKTKEAADFLRQVAAALEQP